MTGERFRKRNSLHKKCSSVLNFGMGNTSGKTNVERPRPTRMNNGYIRRAYHAGSWYSDDEAILNGTLSRYLTAASNDYSKRTKSGSASTESSSLRGIICPHAGFSYSGPTAAYGYSHLEQELSKKDSPIRHIIVFHPAHHVYLDGCAVSGAHTIETPLGNLSVDSELRDEILDLASKKKSGRGSSLGFSVMDRDTDEEEHSGEMQYPFIVKVQKAASQKNGNRAMVPVLPIMCGSISNSKESGYGKLLADIVAREDVFSVISTDFCHWGHRFSYQPTPSSSVEIYEYIQNLDRQGMSHIEKKEPAAFADYLKETRNTICGRHAVQTWLNAVVYAERGGTDNLLVCKSCDGHKGLNLAFNKYAQSSNVRSMRESSVSYASASAFLISRPST